MASQVQVYSFVECSIVHAVRGQVYMFRHILIDSDPLGDNMCQESRISYPSGHGILESPEHIRSNIPYGYR